MTENPSPPLDLFDPQYFIDRTPVYHRLRAESPVYPMPMLGGYLLTRYADIAMVLKDPRIGSVHLTLVLSMLPEEAQQQLAELRRSITMWMGHTNPEDHMRFQKLLKRYFTPQTVEGMRPRTQQFTDEILAQYIGKGKMEIVEELAYPLPASVIADLLGVPLKDRELLQRWSKDIGRVFQTFDVNQLLQSQKGLLEMEEYMRPIVAERRRDRRQDLISILVTAQEEGIIHNELEILANCVLLLFAGHETTANLISHGLRLLLSHPEQLAKLRARPELMPSAIEEMLRFDGPAQLIARMPVEDVVIAGQPIPARRMLYMSLAAANRDPVVFPDPDRFDIEREGAKHLGFGQGTFYCLGAALARMEASVCFSTLLPRLPNLRAADIAPEWRALPPLSRQLAKYHVEF
jgi:cytochrome P450